MNYHSATEEEPAPNGQGPSFMAPSAKCKAGPRKGCTSSDKASLATSVNELVPALPAINQQLLLLAGCLGGFVNEAAALRQLLGGAVGRR